MFILEETVLVRPTDQPGEPGDAAYKRIGGHAYGVKCITQLVSGGLEIECYDSSNPDSLTVLKPKPGVTCPWSFPKKDMTSYNGNSVHAIERDVLQMGYSPKIPQLLRLPIN